MKYSKESRRLALTAIAFLILTGAFGCGRSLGTVSGRVTFQDQPVTAGSVVLYCEGQQIVRGPIAPDGTYTIPNVPRGEVRVTVVPPVRLPDGFKKKYPTPPVIDGPTLPDAGRAPKTTAIPARYCVPEESGLTLKVGRSATEFDIRLTR
jgi:hypothetical protein